MIQRRKGSGALGFHSLSPRAKDKADGCGFMSIIVVLAVFLLTTAGVCYHVGSMPKNSATEEKPFADATFTEEDLDDDLPHVERPPDMPSKISTPAAEEGPPRVKDLLHDHDKVQKGLSSEAGVQCDKADDMVQCATLVHFAEATHYQKWNDATGWLRGGPLCTWHGIRCDTNKNVFEISLHENGLSGQMPEILSSLKSLKTLDLRGNKISGILPNLKNPELRHLNVANNIISGWVPDLIEVPMLKSLHLEGNNLSGELNMGLGMLTELEELFLDDNTLTGEIPDSFSQLTKLTTFSIGKNQFKGQLLDFSAMKDLKSLQLHQNWFESIPENFCDLPAKLFDAGGCNLHNNMFTCEKFSHLPCIQKCKC